MVFLHNKKVRKLSEYTKLSIIFIKSANIGNFVIIVIMRRFGK